MAGMLDVARWLADQGLGHHAEVFAKSGIGADVFGDLTDADLKELGLNLGDRKRLLKAIGALSAGLARDRAEAAEPKGNGGGSSRSGTASAHGYVRRSGGLDASVGAARPLGLARCHGRVPSLYRRTDRAL